MCAVGCLCASVFVCEVCVGVVGVFECEHVCKGVAVCACVDGCACVCVCACACVFVCACAHVCV